MNSAQDLAQKAVNSTFSFKIGSLEISPSYIQAVAVVILLFLLILTLARLRKLYVDWSLKGAATMLFLGFMLALILEGFLIIGGRTALTEVLGWKSAPKPVQKALDVGRLKLVDVLGVTEEIPSTNASETPTMESVIEDFQNLSPEDTKKAKELICTP